MRLELEYRTYDDGGNGVSFVMEASDAHAEPDIDLSPWLLAFERITLRAEPGPRPELFVKPGLSADSGMHSYGGQP